VPALQLRGIQQIGMSGPVNGLTAEIPDDFLGLSAFDAQFSVAAE
jgi:hypothetical protein